jgi:hypothetical protein
MSTVSAWIGLIVVIGAKYSEDPGIPEQAQQLLADWTLMDNDAFIRDGAKFIDTCKSYGQ